MNIQYIVKLQSPTLNFVDLIQNNRQLCKNIIMSCELHGILLAINETVKGRTLWMSTLSQTYTSFIHNHPCIREIIKIVGLMGKIDISLLCSYIATIPSCTVHDINVQYSIFYPLYNIENNSLLIFVTNGPYGEVD